MKTNNDFYSKNIQKSRLSELKKDLKDRISLRLNPSYDFEQMSDPVFKIMDSIILGLDIHTMEKLQCALSNIETLN